MNPISSTLAFLLSARALPQLSPPVLLALASLLPAQTPAQSPAQLDGYLGVPNTAPDSTFSGGYSMYISAWPLQSTHPGPDFQTVSTR